MRARLNLIDITVNVKIGEWIWWKRVRPEENAGKGGGGKGDGRCYSMARPLSGFTGMPFLNACAGRKTDPLEED